MRAFDEGDLRTGQSGSSSAENVVSDNTNWQQLGFNKPAFEDNCNGRYFPVASWDDAFNELDLFCQDNDPLLVVPAITGSGKTSLLTQFMAQQNNPLSTHYLKARSIFSLRHLLNAISENFSEFRNVSSNTEQFLTELRTVTRDVGPQLLIIDDAQRLSRETLMSLLQVLAGQDLSDLWLRVILCGEPQLEDRVQSLFDELELAFSFPAITLEPMTQAETRSYLKHHLDIAGFEGPFPFSKSMVKHIHTLSSGFPGRINRVAQQVLIDSAKRQMGSSMGGIGQVWNAHKVKLVSLFILTGAITTFWYIQHSSAPLAQRPVSQLPLASANHSLQQTASSQQMPQHQGASVNFTHQTNKPLFIPLPHGPAPLKDLSTSQQRTLSATPSVAGSSLPSPQQTTSTQGNKPFIPAPVTRTEPIFNSPAFQSQTNAMVQPTNTGTISSASTRVNIPTSVAQMTPLSTASPTLAADKHTTAVTHKSTTQPHSVVTKPKPKLTHVSLPAPAVAMPKAKVAVNYHNSKIVANSTNGFTLQLLGVHDKAKLDDFVWRHHLTDNIGYYKTSFAGKPWYVLIYGEYDTIEQAHHAATTLPGYLQQQHPWVKSFKNINGRIHWLDENA